MALTAVVVVGAVAIAAASGGVALAATATVAMGCSTVGGMPSAKAAGGKYEDGALAGACGCLAALAMGTVSSNPVHSRVTGSLVYDVVYEKPATGSVDPESLALTAVDVGLYSQRNDQQYSKNQGHTFNSGLSEIWWIRNMQIEIAFMLG